MPDAVDPSDTTALQENAGPLALAQGGFCSYVADMTTSAMPMLPRIFLAALTVAATLLFPAMTTTSHAQTTTTETAATQAKATLGGGCFWCTEAVFERLPGVSSVVSGYAGGSITDPTYEQVCSGTTGHAEVIQITFDPAKISFEKILETFWEAHDPTTLNRQGADHGTQYRSVIFYHDDAQKKVAESSKTAAQKHFSSPIVTEISALPKFYPAEGYHQDYFRRNSNKPYCQMVIRPKLDKFEKKQAK